MSRIAVYPGSFDPITKGHVNVIKRALNLFDQVIVAVAINQSKSVSFNVSERLQLIEQVFLNQERLIVKPCTGLVVDFAREQGANMLVRGVRNVRDYEHELQLAGMNRCLDGQIDTVLLPTVGELSCVSSTLVREIIALGGDVSAFVPEAVVTYLSRKAKNFQTW